MPLEPPSAPAPAFQASDQQESGVVEPIDDAAGEPASAPESFSADGPSFGDLDLNPVSWQRPDSEEDLLRLGGARGNDYDFMYLAVGR